MNFTEKDIQQVEDNGLTEEKILSQIEVFKKGLTFIDLIQAATLGNGIVSPSDEDKQRYIDAFEACRNQLLMIKFVPASGAATRMFKFLFEFLEQYKPDEESLESYISRCSANDLKVFVDHLEKLALYDQIAGLNSKIEQNYIEATKGHRLAALVHSMLSEEGLNWGSLPKGLFPFHKYENHLATAFEEHLFEGASYTSSNGIAQLHFTISDQHLQRFKNELEKIRNRIEQQTKTNLNVVFSTQENDTDTIAVNPDYTPFRKNDGSLLFRPSGHGALLQNLNKINADIIFVKNIDNIVMRDHSGPIIDYKKMLAGILIELRDASFKHLEYLDREDTEDEGLEHIIEFLSKKMFVVVDSDFHNFTLAEKKRYLFNSLNRPIRVCGMVKNEGEPGGGPFWVKDEKGTVSLQIVETSQINIEMEGQMKILQSATHFNPVDLVCSTKDYKGEPFDLTEFVDPKTAFISEKTQSGRALKALELPGLWNGSMAYWNTVFVEVPLFTFNPVKTINDLLKPKHQSR